MWILKIKIYYPDEWITNRNYYDFFHLFALFHHSWRWILLLGCAPAHGSFMWKSQDISGRVNLSVRIKASSNSTQKLRPELADNKSQSRRRPYQRNHYKLHASNLEERDIYLINIYLFSHGMLSSTNATRAQIQQLNRKCNIFHNFSTEWKFIASLRTVLFRGRVRGHSQDYRPCISTGHSGDALKSFHKRPTLLILYEQRRRQIVYWCSGADKRKKDEKFVYCVNYCLHRKKRALYALRKLSAGQTRN